MKRIVKMVLVSMIIITGVCAGIYSFNKSSVPMTQFITMSNAESKSSVLSWYEGDKTVIAKVDKTGTIHNYYSFDTSNGSSMYTIKGISAGENDLVYVLRYEVDKYNGDILDQQLVIVDFGGLVATEKKIFSLLQEDENYQYGWINVNGDTISLIAKDPSETKAIRKTFEYGALLSGTLAIKNTIIYPLAENEGIYSAIGNSTNLVYISDSGKIFFADEEKVYEVYPARVIEKLMYPTFISYAESGYIFFGEHETGDIIKLNLTTGEEKIVTSGNSTFSGSNLYTPQNVVSISMSNISTFSALVYNNQESAFNLLVSEGGEMETITSLHYSFIANVLRFLFYWFLYTVFGIIGILVVIIFVSGIRNGRTIIGRLIYVSVPLIVCAMVAFGLIAYTYYRDAITDNFKKQTIDEGNMLTALFGQATFGEVEYPYHYVEEGYKYIQNQLSKRDLYSRVLYYQNKELYIGVDQENPCFYPVGILLNLELEALYKEAALTGEPIVGTIQDGLGERLVCITPVGGLTGEDVYLMESGMFSSNIDKYMKDYIRNFGLACGSFFVIIFILLSIAYYRILLPISDIKNTMKRFVGGDKDARVEISSEDELSGISHVFNKMAEDMNIQRFNFEKMSDIYYRFVPVSMMNFLGKDNLADIELGSKVEGNFVLIKAFFVRETGLTSSKIEKLSNRFFATINKFALQNEVVPIVDDTDLSSIMMICKKDADSAIITALSILAKIDADNALVEDDEQINIRFVIHRSRAMFSICGDEQRFIPSILSPEFDVLFWDWELLRETGSRIVITGLAFDELSSRDTYANRFIGSIPVGEGNLKIYDVYDEKPAEEIRTMKQTQKIFDKAMELFEKEFYYEAKNLFTMVLRENKSDLVAKYYIFKCEKLQTSK